MWKLLFCILTVLSGAQVLAGETEIDQALDEMLEHSVPLIRTQQLAEVVSSSDIIVLDSREKAEFELSHLPNSIWVGYDDFSLDNVSQISKDKKVVVYCSIGVRSEKVAEKLKQAGFTDVHNLYGGIFSWANEKKPLFDHNQQVTHVVHGYNRKWAKLLEEHVASPQK
jgi:rhodanese-related sulfurtransferase